MAAVPRLTGMQVNDPVDPPFDEQCSVPTGYVDPPGWALDPAGPFDVDPSPSLQNDNVTHFALARPAAFLRQAAALHDPTAILARAAQVLHDGTGLDALPQQQADRRIR